MRIVIFLLSLMSLTHAQTPPIEPGVSHELAKWRAAHYSDVRYKLNLTLEKMSPVLKGTIEVRVVLRDAGSGGRGDAERERHGDAVIGGRGDAGTTSSPPSEGGVAAALGGRGGSLIILDWRKIKGFEERSSISNVSINGKPAENHPVGEAPTPLLRKEGSPLVFSEHNEHLIFRDGVVAGENVIKLDFTSPILPSGSAITRYVDKEDGAEYIYSLFVPSDASTAFPVFDQPDLKARFSLSLEIANEWQAVSNSEYLVGAPADLYRDKDRKKSYRFFETKPISTYVFAFAAGPWQQVSVPSASARGSEQVSVPSASADGSAPARKNRSANADGTDSRRSIAEANLTGRNPTGREGAENAEPGSGQLSVPSASADGSQESPREVAATGGSLSGSEGANPKSKIENPKSEDTLPTGRVSASSIYVRKSQLAKFQPHAAEVFRLNREGIKFLETYFDYKFPFPKYDLVLIPEFPFGGMEHAGATFLRESSVIFPQEPTKNDHISRANLIFYEAAHQWFGDTVTMKWFDDLWLKEGFAEFMAYKTLEKVMPEYNAWKVFYERNKQAAYLTDSTKGTTPIYQEIKNLNAAKSAYGNIVYRKAPSFLKQAEFYIGPDKFQTAVRAFLKKHEFGNAGWEDLVKEFETGSGGSFNDMSATWIKQPGMWKVRMHEERMIDRRKGRTPSRTNQFYLTGQTEHTLSASSEQSMMYKVLIIDCDRVRTINGYSLSPQRVSISNQINLAKSPCVVFPNYQDYGYGIFLLDDKSRDYVLKNIQNEKDEFLRSMMWGSLWDSVRESELDPKEYVELVLRVLSPDSKRPKGVTQNGEDETTVATLLNRVSTAMTYYVSEKQREAISPRLEAMLIEKMRTAPTLGERITYYRAFLNVASTEKARNVVKEMLRQESVPSALADGSPRSIEATKGNPVATAPGSDSRQESVPSALADGSPRGIEATKGNPVATAPGSDSRHSRQESVPSALADGSPQPNAEDGMRSAERNPKSKIQNPKSEGIPLKTKDRFDIVTRLASLGDPDAEKLLADLEKTETSDDAKRYAYAARAAFPTSETKAKFWNDFTNNKNISESWIESAFGPFNSVRHADLTLPYLERALRELPNHKRNRKIFFVNGWLGAFIGGQRSPEALAIVNKFLADNPNLDRDLRLKILENVDVIERAVKIRSKFATR